MYWLIVIGVLCVAALLGFLVWASSDVGSGVYLDAQCRLLDNQKVVSLTFDDGPSPQMTPRVLDILGKYGIKATFFLIGENAGRYPGIVERIIAEGHVIGNHTYSHKWNFPLSSTGDVLGEISNCEDTLLRLTGGSTKLFRPPFGVTNPHIGRAVRLLGLRTIGWSIRSLDTVEKHSWEMVCSRILDRLHPGAIILLHDRCRDEDKLLEMLIPGILDRGYSFRLLD